MDKLKDLPKEVQREVMLTECWERGRKLIAIGLSKVSGKEGEELKKNISHGLPFSTRYFATWDYKIQAQAELQAREDARLNYFDAEVSVVTSDGFYFRVLETLGETPDNSYVKVMEAFRAGLPWNKTGHNHFTLRDVTLEDLESASRYINETIEKLDKK